MKRKKPKWEELEELHKGCFQTPPEHMPAIEQPEREDKGIDVEELLRPWQSKPLSDLIAIYAPLLQTFQRIRDEKGDTCALQSIAESGVERLLRFFFRFYLENTLGLDKIDPEALVERWQNTNLITRLILDRKSQTLEEYLSALYWLEQFNVCAIELEKRTEIRPELVGLLMHKICQDISSFALAKVLAPPDKEPDSGWAVNLILGAIEGIKGGIINLPKGELAASLQALWDESLIRPFPLVSGNLQRGIHEIKVVRMTGQEGIAEGMKYWSEKDYNEIIVAGLQRKLINSLKLAARRNIIDEIRKIPKVEIVKDGQTYKVQTEIPESALVTEDGDIQQSALELVAAKQGLFHLGADEEAEAAEPVTLKDLDLDLSGLTPTEYRVLEEALQALQEGYDLDSKKGRSLKQWWGKDYQRKRRAYERAMNRILEDNRP